MSYPESFRIAEIAYRQTRIAGDVARGRSAAPTRRGRSRRGRLVSLASAGYRVAGART